MKRNFQHIMIMCVFLTSLSSCKNTLTGNLDQAPLPTTETSILTSSELDGLAQAINAALLTSPDFNATIKGKALEKFDGDFDVMLKTLGEQEVSDFHSTRSMGGSTTIAMMLDELYPADTRSGITSDNIIEYLTEKYPLLQVSVPVHAEDWEEGYIPTVVFIGDDYVDGVTEFVKGYDNTGKEVWVDAINEPDVPVIVISMNERGGLDATRNANRGTDIDFEQYTTRVMPDTGLIINPSLDRLMAPINVTATTTATGINVAWSMNSTSLPATKYYIYRKCETENDFVNVGISNGTNNTTYNDVDIIANLSYSYYVKAYSNTEGYSQASAIVSAYAPNIVNPVETFSAIPQNSTSVLLQWTQLADAAITGVNVYRKRVSTDNTALGTCIASNISPMTYQYSDTPPVSGELYTYSVENLANGRVSAVTSDQLYHPYRNHALNNPVYVTRIQFNESDYEHIEGWLRGAPEFRLQVSLVQGDTKSVLKPVDENGRFYLFSSRTANQSFAGSNALFNWLKVDRNTTYDKMVVSITEYEYQDVDAQKGVTVNIGCKISALKALTIEPFSLSFTMDFNSHDESIGLVQHCYYENPSQALEAGNYDFKIHISETN
ncbi:MAG: hypothetical protein E7134_04700 [Rikenellaceae bacterium]|nr:hypothetical protein [Rikenellaceae bacterium]